MVKLKIEIDLNDLIDRPLDVNRPKSQLATVPVDFNNELLNNAPVWWKQYNKGIKWVRIEGRGANPKECKNIVIRMSPGNTDMLEDVEYYHDITDGEISYDDYPEDMYVQSERLRQLEDLGYVEGENNFIELI